MTNKVRKNTKCLICASSKLIKYLDLGKSALANSYVKKSNLRKKELVLPLRVFYCTNCHLAQLTDLVDRKLLFEKYAYSSSDSPQLEAYFKKYKEGVAKKFPKQSKQLILEIASNDGILLKYFKKSGAKVLGVDPAKNIAKVANKNGINTLPIFFNPMTAEIILEKFGKADIVLANNVLAHTDNPNGIINGVKKILTQRGVFIFEVQYLADLLEKNAFDNTYHEHISYFSLAPIITLLKKHDLQIFDIERTEAQGGSIRVSAGHMPLAFPLNTKVEELERKERGQGLHNLETYKRFSKRPEKVRKDLIKLLKKLKKQGKIIVGYGASAKGNTMLQYCGIGRNILDYIVDDAPSKIGKYTPGTHIPIFSSKRLKKDTPDYVLLLAWNYADSIMRKEAWLSKKGVKFINPIPKLKII